MKKNTQNQELDELNSLLDQLKPYKFIFKRDAKITADTIVIKLNPAKTKIVIITPNNQEREIDAQQPFDSITYSNIRTELQNKVKQLDESELTKKAAEQILTYLKNHKMIEDRESFLVEFKEFLDQLPQISPELQGYLGEISSVKFDDIDIDSLDENDPNLKKLGELHKKILDNLGTYKTKGEEYLKKRSESEEEKATEDSDLIKISGPEFMNKYPEQSEKLKQIFQILNKFTIEDNPAEIAKIAHALKLDEAKFQCYFQARSKVQDKLKGKSLTSEVTPSIIASNDYWYSDEDMARLGKRLEKYGVDVEKQFKGRLTKDVISALPKAEDSEDGTIKGLEEGKPIFISYNIGGEAAREGGVHWVAICLVKHNGIVKVLYKDSLGDYGGNSKGVESAFREHYRSGMEFIRHEGKEQEDGSACGPMTISNLEKMAEKAQGNIDSLVNGFRDMHFTKQDEVLKIRNEHVELIFNFNISKSIVNEDNIRKVDEIIKELKLFDKDEETLKSNIIEAIEKINQAYNEAKGWGVIELADWSRKYKGVLDKNSSDEICKAIGYMERANEIAMRGHRLHDTQKVAIFIFMKTNDKGHISQINTGEGKTTIVSFVQALKVMQGYKGHVITSNEVLANEGVKNKKVFYDLLGITVADNNPGKEVVSGARACYSKDIVYGNINNFQFDWLRHSFERLKTMGELDFKKVWVMLDEIDSLLIDQGGNIAKLSGPFPGMESLRYVYINIWIALAQAESKVEEEMLAALKDKAKELDTKQSQLKEELSIKYREILSEHKEDKQPEHIVEDLELRLDTIAKPDDLEHLQQFDIEYEEFEDELREGFLDKVKEKVKAQKDGLINKSIIAKHLHEYAEASVERWIEYAFAAKYQYSENVEYKIGKDKNGEGIIVPVDNQNTGVSMKNTILSNGLHQFLQIKHNLCLTYESLTSSYISNLGYILNQYVDRDAEKIVCRVSGVTGTLGSDSERDLLGEVFSLEFSVIPTYKPKQFQIFPGKIAADDEFVNLVSLSALSEVTRYRASLIVCSSIRDVEAIDQEIRKEANGAGLNPRIKTYRDEGEAHITEQTLESGYIVIATNIAGRGTDFKTSKALEENGGLHVIEAFLPCNKRVEDQGLGRTSRQGNYGTGQIIARISELEELGIKIDDKHFDFQEAIKQRDQLESERVSDIRLNKVIELEFKDSLFNKFKELYGGLKEEHKKDGDPRWTYVLSDLKEKWAFWLEKQKYTTEKVKSLIAEKSSIGRIVEEEFTKFSSEIEEIVAGNIKYNPFYSICLAELYLEEVDKESRVKAKIELQNALAIGNDSDLLYSAHMKLFEVSIENGGQVLERYKKAVAKVFSIDVDKDETYKASALEHLKKARTALKRECEYLEELITGKPNKDDAESSTSALDSILIPKTQKAEGYWYDDEDMDKLGKRLEKYGVDVNKQFKGRLTKDVISDLPKAEDSEDGTIKGLEEGKPIFISYNIGGEAAKEGGFHWVAMFLVKHNGIVKLLYKDSLGDFGGNAKGVESAFREYYGSEIEFIRHEGKEQEDGSACGPMTISNLEKMAEKAQGNIGSLVEDFLNMSFTRQDEVPKVRIDHGNLKDETNVLVKHLNSRGVVLGVYLHNIETLIVQIGGPEELEGGGIEGLERLKDGIIIDTKIPRYLTKLGSKLDHERKIKEAITDKEVDEVEYIGMNSIIQLREVHDVADEVVENAQWQIAGGLAALAITIPFPFLLPINGPIAGALIGEGITDIVMALIDQGQVGFNKKDYVKGKLISYGISIVTMGIGAIASSTKILTRAMNSCKSLASKLKAIKGPFAKVCTWAGEKLDKLANYFELCIKKIEMAKKTMDGQKAMLSGLQSEAGVAEKAGKIDEFNKLTNQITQLKKLEKVSDIAVKHSQQLMQILKTSVTGAVKGVAISVAMEKIFTATLNNIMAGLKPQIEAKIKGAVAVKINAGKARLSKYPKEIINEKIQTLFETSLNEDIEHIAKEISLGVLRHSNNWKMQLAVLALDTLISGIDIGTCADKICNKFLSELGVLPEEEQSYEHNYEQIINQLGGRISEVVYSKIVAITGKVVVTLPKVLYRGYKQHKDKIADKQKEGLIKQRIEEANLAEESAKQKNTGCVHNAVSESLGIKDLDLTHASGLAMSTEGASKEDIRSLYNRNDIATTECDISGAVEQIGKCGSDRAVVCLKKDGCDIGHAMMVTSEGGKLMVVEKGQKVSLDAYCAENGYSAQAIVIPHGVNAEKIADGSITRLTNHNRVAKLAHPLDYVGKDSGEKFGGKQKAPVLDTGKGELQDTGGNYNNKTRKQEKTGLKLGGLDEKFMEEIKKKLEEGKNIFTKPNEGQENIFKTSGNRYVNGCDGSENVGLAMHHIYPKEKIMEELNKLSTQELRSLFKEMNPSIKKEIMNLVEANVYNNYLDACSAAIYYDPSNIRLGPAKNRKYDPDKIDIKDPRDRKHKFADLYEWERIDYELIPKSERKAFSEGMKNAQNLFERLKFIKKANIGHPLWKKGNDGGYIVSGHIDLDKKSYYGGTYYNKNKWYNIRTGETLDEGPTLSGTEDYSSISNGDEINSFDMKYSLNKIVNILELRLKDFDLNNINIFPAYVLENYGNDLDKALKMIKDEDQETSFIPINLYNKHAVGVMLVRQEDGSFKGYYIDPENKQIPDILSSIMSEQNIIIEQLIVEQQKYSNCGPELVEDFMLYLTGERLDQQDAIKFHSQLVELDFLDHEF